MFYLLSWSLKPLSRYLWDYSTFQGTLVALLFVEKWANFGTDMFLSNTNVIVMWIRRCYTMNMVHLFFHSYMAPGESESRRNSPFRRTENQTEQEQRHHVIVDELLSCWRCCFLRICCCWPSFISWCTASTVYELSCTVSLCEDVFEELRTRRPAKQLYQMITSCFPFSYLLNSGRIFSMQTILNSACEL